MKNLCILGIIGGLFISFPSFADTSSDIKSDFSRTNQQCDNKCTQTQLFEKRVQIFTAALKDAHSHKKDLGEILKLSDELILKHWDIKSTLLSLIGRERWRTLTDKEKSTLSQSFSSTLTRYFLEAYQYYQGQEISFSELKLNSQGNKGWLTLSVKLDLLPDIKLDINVFKKSNDWYYRDLRVQGISFAQMKRQEYQAVIDTSGVLDLIKNLNEKNEMFFSKNNTASSSRVL